MPKNQAQKQPKPIAGLVAGAIGGSVASLAMNLLQARWNKLIAMPRSGQPSTVKAAQKIGGVLGEPVRSDRKRVAGEWVHYVFGAVLGGAYGILAEYRPKIAAGKGSAFGLASALVFDEVAVPATKLSKPSTSFPPITHAYSVVSHVLYGLVTDVTRRALVKTVSRSVSRSCRQKISL